jgi:hypothetical protein
MNMKNKLFIGLLLSLFALQACVKDEEKVFDVSAAERMNAAIQTYKATLCAAPGGWVMEYYPELDRSLGGYNFILKFYEDGKVAIAGEIATTNYPAGTPATSTYEVMAGEGAVLTFNTYNEVLHVFTEPNASDVDGYAGDYEFVIREVTPGQIVLTGKKYGNKILLTPYTGGDSTTWANYIKQFSVVAKKMDAPVYVVSVDGTDAAIKRVTRKYRAFQFAYKNAEGDKIVPYITTAAGIKLYEPLTINGKTAQNFTLDTIAGLLRSVEAGSNMAIKMSVFPPNDFFAETATFWVFNYALCSSSFKTLIDNAKTATTAAGFTCDEIYCGRSLQDTNRMFGFFVRQNNTGTYGYLVYNFLFTPIAGTDDKIKLEFSSYGINGKLIPALKTGFIDTITAKSPYSVAVNDPKNITKLTLTSVADPNFYFVVVY